MDNKSDWDELEQWNKKRLETETEESGFDFEKINTSNQNKKVSRFAKGFKLTGILSIIFIIVIASIFIYLVVIFIDETFYNMKPKDRTEIIQTIENKYQIKAEILGEDVNRKGNGKYQFKVVNKGIQFTVIKKTKSITDDFLARSHKYYFELWDSEDKNDFTVKEKVKNDLLYYETYIENFDNMEEATNKIKKFIDFCGEEFREDWKVYLKKKRY